MASIEQVPENLEKQISKIEARAATATLGPWCHVRIRPDHPPRKCETITQVLPATQIRHRQYGETILRHEADWLMKPSDQRFLAHARDDVPWLCARLREVLALLDGKEHREWPY